jgi:hypothetical protein
VNPKKARRKAAVKAREAWWESRATTMKALTEHEDLCLAADLCPECLTLGEAAGEADMSPVPTAASLSLGLFVRGL